MYLIGISAFAASGVLAAHRANMDLFGGLTLAFVASISGGTIRDLILDRRPLYWTRDWVLLAVIVGTAAVTIAYLKKWSPPHRALLTVDALGLAVVTVIGAEAATHAGVSPPAVVMLAVLTGTAGEVLRDLLCGDSPPLLLREDIYAVAAIAGAVCYIALSHLPLAPAAVTTVSVALVFILRIASMRLGLHLPVLRPRDTNLG